MYIAPPKPMPTISLQFDVTHWSAIPGGYRHGPIHKAEKANDGWHYQPVRAAGDMFDSIAGTLKVLQGAGLLTSFDHPALGVVTAQVPTVSIQQALAALQLMGTVSHIRVVPS